MRAWGNGRTIHSIEANGAFLCVAQRDIFRCLRDPVGARAHWLRDLAVSARCSIDGKLKIGSGKVFTDAPNWVDNQFQETQGTGDNPWVK